MSVDDDDYEERAALVGTRVCVALADGKVTRGLLVGVDPETRHVAVAQAADGDVHGDSGRVRLKILLSHHVQSITRGEDATTADDALLALLVDFGPDNTESKHCVEDGQAVEERAARLAAFLQRHVVPHEVTGGGEIRLFGGAATLLPPFRDADASVASENEQLVGRLRPLLARFLAEEVS